MVIGNSQFGFTKGKFYTSISLISFFERAVDVIYLDFSKAFDTVSLSIPIVKVGRYRPDGKTTRLVENLSSWAQRVVVSRLTSSGWPHCGWCFSGAGTGANTVLSFVLTTWPRGGVCSQQVCRQPSTHWAVELLLGGILAG